jgi:acetolactate synthase I/II/III large subunit
MLGAEIIAKTLATLGVKGVYLYPGGTIAPLLDALVKEGIGYFCARNEQGAGYAAIGAAKVTGSPQVVLVTSGPGATNLLTPVADAYYDSVPIMVFTGQVGTNDINFERKIRQTGFQETDTINIFKPVTKKSFVLGLDDNISQLVSEAFYLTDNDRPGPVLVDLPMDVQKKEFKNGVYHQELENAKTTPISLLNHEIFSQVIEKFSHAKRPLILAGNGIYLSNAIQEFRSFVKETNVPVVCSLPGLGTIPSDDPLSYSFIGHTGEFYSNLALYYSDFLLVLGARLDLRQTGSEIANFRKNKFIVRIDIDNSELQYGRIDADIKVKMDVKDFFMNFSHYYSRVKTNEIGQWMNILKGWREKFDSSQFYKKEYLSTRDIIIKVDEITKSKNVIVTSGVGSHQQFVARYFTFNYPSRLWLTSAGHGTMGFDIPANIGAVMASKNKMGIVFVGDGSFQMNIQELATIKEFNLPIKIFVFDNCRLGIVSQFQLLTWGTDPSTGNKVNPSFSKIGKAYGLKGYDISGKIELDSKIKEIFNDDSPAVVHCHLSSQEDVLPMLLGGQNLNEMYPFKREEL